MRGGDDDGDGGDKHLLLSSCHLIYKTLHIISPISTSHLVCSAILLVIAHVLQNMRNIWKKQGIVQLE